MWVERYQVHSRALRPAFWHSAISQALAFTRGIKILNTAGKMIHAPAAAPRAGTGLAGRPRARVVVHAMKRKEARGLMTAEGFEAALEARGVQVEVKGAENATVRTPRPQHRSSLSSGASLRS